MTRLFDLLLLAFSALVFYISCLIYFDLSKVNNVVSNLNLNLEDQSQSPTVDYLNLAKHEPFKYLFWDANVNTLLGQINTNIANQQTNKGATQTFIAKAEKYYADSLKYRPREFNALLGQISLLIDQGAPVDYVLPKVDELIALIPKDQDLKGEVALICFKLINLADSESKVEQINNRLKKLFAYSMDYRGIRQFKRYAKIYGQQKSFEAFLKELNTID